MNEQTPNFPDKSLAKLRQQRSDEAESAALAQGSAAGLADAVAYGQLAIAGNIAEHVKRSMAASAELADPQLDLASAMDRMVRLSRTAIMLLKVSERLATR
jgi:hypothetical protein